MSNTKVIAGYHVEQINTGFPVSGWMVSVPSREEADTAVKKLREVFGSVGYEYVFMHKDLYYFWHIEGSQFCGVVVYPFKRIKKGHYEAIPYTGDEAAHQKAKV